MTAVREKPCTGRPWAFGLFGAVLLGAVLRLVCVMDMEYKEDEAYMFDRSQHVGRTEPWPWLGMPSGVGVRNPGMSVWVFVLLGKVAGSQDPTALARGVQVLNIVAIIGVIAFAWLLIPQGEREPWLWAAALVSVNPLAVVLHRKIWAQSVLPPFSLVMLVGWWRRDCRWGAFTWGLVGACLGQIHMSGFFLAAGFTAWALLFQRKGVRWWSWLAGSCLGALPLIPWLYYLLTDLGQVRTTRSPFHLPGLDFWTLWVEDGLGLTLSYSLNLDFLAFLRYPRIGGWPTYLVCVLHVVIIATGVAILTRGVRRFWQNRHRWGEACIGRESATAFTQSAAWWGFGILLTASTLTVYRHFLAVAFPLELVWLARLALAPGGKPAGVWKFGRSLLAALCVAQVLLSASFLHYIHLNGGAAHGDYGIAYGAQERGKSALPTQ